MMDNTRNDNGRIKWLNIAGVLDGQVTTIPASAIATRRAVFSLADNNVEPELVKDIDGVARFVLKVDSVETAVFTVTEFDADNTQVTLRITNGIDYERGQWDELREDRTRANKVIGFVASRQLIVHILATTDHAHSCRTNRQRIVHPCDGRE